ncbi:MAG: hypothetical protein MUC48_14445 [Leptolyngbya sp. Prado105]|jgi:hypothetical protein|nr:hypothetical protein [Leptolyngbya sp. Prado105]
MTITTYHSIWLPKSEVIQHHGKPLPANMIFFAAPPPEIGTVLTAHSYLEAKQRKLSLKIFKRFSRVVLEALVLAGLCFGIFVGLHLGLSVPFFSASTDGMLRGFVLGILITPFATIGVAVFCLSLIKPPITCTYVGDRGIAEYRWSDQGEPEGRVLQFSQVDCLHRNIIDHYINFSYMSTEYWFTWANTRNLPESEQSAMPAIFKFTLSGKYSSEFRLPLYHFALSAERAWTEFRLQHLLSDVKQSGSTRFEIGKLGVSQGKALEVGQGFVRTIVPNRIHHFNGDEIRLRQENGKILLQRKDPSAGWARPWMLETIGFASFEIENVNAFVALFNLLVNQE